MSKFITYNSTLTAVLTGGTFDHRELSGRPEFTGGNYSTLNNTFSGSVTLEGYNFDSVTQVMLSCLNLDPLFTDSPSVTSFNFYNSITAVSTNSTPFSGLSAYYPEVSGVFTTQFPVLTSNYTLNNYNSMSITFPVVTAVGEVDIIAINSAGYGKFSTDVGSTSGIRIIN